MAKGIFPEDHPLSLGMTGHLGHARRQRNGSRDADVILAVGTGFGEADCSSWNPKYTFAIPPSTADPDRHRPAGDRQDLSGRGRHRRRRESDARASWSTRCARGRCKPNAARTAAVAAGQGARGSASWPPSSATPASRSIRPGCCNEISKVAPRRHHLRHRRRLEQERRRAAVGGAAAAYVHHQRRHGDDGIRARRPRSAPRSARPTSRSLCLVGDGGFLSVVGALTTAVELGIPWSGCSSTTSASRRSARWGPPTSRTPTAPSSRRRTASPTTRTSCMLAQAPSASRRRGSKSPTICRRR